ncbi:F-box protein At5g07610-like isoform X1 [Quercus robur]|uniref:F-box protein At5g07610-like isoform X1 n=1 Tax=Quercus robur TaxID=38942 RepID=UPI0021620A87|nr:F-box protein At5g07610-like isoform X1 [Quercus robur]
MDICALPCKKPNSESKQTSIDDLSNDLLIEILHRIPLKPAHRFKCVSKRWVQVICQPQFAQRFTQRMKLLYPSQPSPPFTLFFQCSFPRPFPVEFKHFQRDPQFMSSYFSLSFLPQSPNPIIFLATSNGLVLCSTTLLSQMMYYVCNPLTANWVALVPPRFDSHVLAGFVCHSYYDDSDTITRFKVVRVSAIETGKKSLDLCVEIFNSDTSEWQQFTEQCEGLHVTLDFTKFQTHAVLAHNDIMHWAHCGSRYILAFDPNNKHDHKCRLIRQPRELYDMYGHVCLSACQGRLRCMFLSNSNNYTLLFQHWELEDYIAGKWCLVAKFPVSNTNLLRVLGIHPVDPNIVYLLRTKNIVLLNAHTQQMEVVYYFTEGQFGRDNTMMNPFELYMSKKKLNAFQFVLQWWPTPVPKLDNGTLNTYHILLKNAYFYMCVYFLSSSLGC